MSLKDLKEAVESLLHMGKSKPPQGEDPISLVLLLQQPRFPSLDQLREAAARAFGVTFASDRNSRHSVYQRGVIFTLANVGSHTLSFLSYTQPYCGQELAGAMQRTDQRNAWNQHTAWIAVDYAKGEVNLNLRRARDAMRRNVRHELFGTLYPWQENVRSRRKFCAPSTGRDHLFRLRNRQIGASYLPSLGKMARTLQLYSRYSSPNLLSSSPSSIRIITAPVAIANAVNTQQTSNPVPMLHASISHRCARYTGCRTRARIPVVISRSSRCPDRTSGNPPSCAQLKCAPTRV